MKKFLLLIGALSVFRINFAAEFATGLVQRILSTEIAKAAGDKIMPRSVVAELEANGRSVVLRKRMNQEHRFNRVITDNANDAGTPQLCQDIIAAKKNNYPIGTTAPQIALEHLLKVKRSAEVTAALDILNPGQLAQDVDNPDYDEHPINLTNRTNICLDGLVTQGKAKGPLSHIADTLTALNTRNGFLKPSGVAEEAKNDDAQAKPFVDPIFVGEQAFREISDLLTAEEKLIIQIRAMLKLQDENQKKLRKSKMPPKKAKKKKQEDPVEQQQENLGDRDKGSDSD